MTGFSKNFLWGAASSAYQIEGFSTADNGGVCIWDEFCKIPGKIAWADDGRTACDAYHRWQEDLTLLKELGAGAYRFSTSWARIDPNGDGCWNQAGLGYYDKIVNRCLEYGIEPFMTLYHWELPQAAEDRGGWQSRETSKAFARYAGMMAEHFKGRVKNYFTLNEPQCTVMLGYGLGHHAPGKKLDVNGQFNVHVNQLLAHGMALRAMKAADPDAQIGIASTGRLCYPAGESTEDLDAARSATFDSSDENWVFTHHFLLDPICFGHFPDTANETLRELISHVSAEDLATIHAVPDLLGYNIYNGNPVAAGSGSFRYVNREPGSPRTALKWPVSPDVLHYGVRFLFERYRLPCYITENGLSCNDLIFLDGKVHDPERIDFLTRYLLCLKRAVEDGVDIRGYFHWSLTDNFEWNSGYADRFGLIYIDYPTMQRIPKDSYDWYREVIRTNGENL